MTNADLQNVFQTLSTPLIADACLRLKLSPRVAPTGMMPLLTGRTIAGRVLPCKHYGSVDIFLEVMAESSPGDILVIDNEGRTDEGCIGDLTALEAMARKLHGIIVWGCHRDTPELLRLGLPIFTYGRFPGGPVRLDPREPHATTSARIGSFTVTRNDAVFADDDGAVWVPLSHVDDVVQTAIKIATTERRQAEIVRAGKTLYELLGVEDYVKVRAAKPDRTFRQHLRERGGAIEE